MRWMHRSSVRQLHRRLSYFVDCSIVSYCPCCQWRIPPPPPPPPDRQCQQIPDFKNKSVSRNSCNRSSSNNDCKSIVNCSCYSSLVQPPNHKNRGKAVLDASSAEVLPDKILDSLNESVPKSEQEYSEREKDPNLSICQQSKLERAQCRRKQSHQGKPGDSPIQKDSEELTTGEEICRKQILLKKTDGSAVRVA